MLGARLGLKKRSRSASEEERGEQGCESRLNIARSGEGAAFRIVGGLCMAALFLAAMFVLLARPLL